MAGTQDIINETQENAMSGVDASIPSGAGINSPEERDAIRKAISAKGAWSGMDVARTALVGAGLGSQTQATNPMTAFLQGVTAGLGAPAEVYRAKQDQIKSAVGASPFGAIVEEANNPDNPLYAFRGLPYELVSKAVSGIALESVKIAKQGEEERKTEKFKADEILKGKNPDNLKHKFDISAKFDSIPQAADFNAAKPAYEAAAGAPGDAAGDKTLLINYARLLSPTFRGNEATMAAVDVSGIFDRATVGLWNKAVNGTDLQPSERAMIKKEATRIFNTKERAYNERMSFWREQAAQEGFDPSVIGKKYGTPKPMKMSTGEVVYVVDDGMGNMIEVGGE